MSHMGFDGVLKRLRKEAGLSQIAVAKYVGVDRQQISRWENGRQKPVQRQMSQLCALFNKSLKQLQGEEPIDKIDPAPVEEIRRQLKAMIELLDRQSLLDIYGQASGKLRSALESDAFMTRMSMFRSGDDFPKGRVAR